MRMQLLIDLCAFTKAKTRWGYPRRLIQTSAACVFASQFLGVAFYCRCFSAFTFGSRFFIELTTTNFCQNTRFFAGTFEATQSYVERLVFTYFNYRHVPLTSIKSVCLLMLYQHISKWCGILLQFASPCKAYRQIETGALCNPSATLYARFCVGRRLYTNQPKLLDINWS